MKRWMIGSGSVGATSQHLGVHQKTKGCKKLECLPAPREESLEAQRALEKWRRMARNND
jgi:hypothetical protein